MAFYMWDGILTMPLIKKNIEEQFEVHSKVRMVSSYANTQSPPLSTLRAMCVTVLGC